MKYVINIILLALTVLLVYFLIESISEPIKFIDQKQFREKYVIDKLKDIRKSQEIYREITGKFAGSFDTLVNILKTKPIPIIKIIGNPDEIKSVKDVKYETVYLSALDSIKRLNINLDSLKFIPFGEGKEFTMQAAEIEYQKTKVNVVEVGARYKDFMGPFGDKRFKKYEKGFDPDNSLKFGDMSSPNLTGNWE
jgi:hypothetical protein